MSGEYGKSIMIPEMEDAEESGLFPEEALEIDQETLDELKANDPGKVKAIKTLDPISGIMGSGVIDQDNIETVSEILDESDRDKRKFNAAGLHDIKTIFKGTIPEGLIETLSDTFDKYTHIMDFKAAIKDPNMLRSILGPQLTDEISKRILVNDTVENILSRVAIKLYESYRSEDGIYNDIEELQKLTETLYSKTDNGDNVNEENLDGVMKDLNKLTRAIGAIEEHAERIKLPKYDIHDIDIRLVDEIRETYEYALSFTPIKQLLSDADLCRKFKLDLNKNRKAALNRLEGWVAELIEDPKVIYTFPTSAKSAFDKVHHKAATTEFIQYMMTSLSRHYLAKFAIDLDEASEVGLLEFYKKKGYITQKDIDMLNDMSICFGYVMSRCFKYKNIETSRDRRVLSYTLDFISKSMTPQYRKDFYDIVEYVYNKIMK